MDHNYESSFLTIVHRLRQRLLTITTSDCSLAGDVRHKLTLNAQLSSTALVRSRERMPSIAIPYRSFLRLAPVLYLSV